MTDNTAFRIPLVNVLLVVILLTASCSPVSNTPPAATETATVDIHSFANLDEFEVKHLALDLEVLFEEEMLRGTATLSFSQKAPASAMVLDTRDLNIEKVEVSYGASDYQETTFEMGTANPILGTPLSIQVPITSGTIRIHYSTSPNASALLWLSPQQTAGKKHPFLFTQSETIHARSWIPLQDTPMVKIPYSARVRTPQGLLAVMSAGNLPDPPRDGDYNFEMTEPVPSYLIALAVGDLQFRSLGKRTGVFAEPSIVDRAAAEFEDTEQMLDVAENLFGSYVWGRFDLLVLPPSFPFGGMENPRLTFLTPTLLAGDKSLVSVIAHEMAHSWSGNLVTNATWSDAWLNEGITVYLESRITEEVYGPERAAMETVLGRQRLQQEMDRLDERDQVLHVDLVGRHPDEAFTQVPYEKGALLMHTLEQACSRDPLDSFLRGYFERFASKSITTAQFFEELDLRLLDNSILKQKVPLREWIYEPGIPAGAFQPVSEAFSRVEEQAAPWLEGRAAATTMKTASWSTQEWLHFLGLLPADIGSARMRELDNAFHFTRTGNSEILFEWLMIAIRNNYEPANPRLREFLTSMGRRKYLEPLYRELATTPRGREQALAIYKSARSTYHSISVTSVDEVLGWPAE